MPAAYWDVPTAAPQQPLAVASTGTPDATTPAASGTSFRPADVPPMHESWSAPGDGVWVALTDPRHADDPARMYKRSLTQTVRAPGRRSRWWLCGSPPSRSAPRCRAIRAGERRQEVALRATRHHLGGGAGQPARGLQRRLQEHAWPSRNAHRRSDAGASAEGGLHRRALRRRPARHSHLGENRRRGARHALVARRAGLHGGARQAAPRARRRQQHLLGLDPRGEHRHSPLGDRALGERRGALRGKWRTRPPRRPSHGR